MKTRNDKHSYGAGHFDGALEEGHIWKAKLDAAIAERDEAREIAYSARRIADKHAATVLELRDMVNRLACDLRDTIYEKEIAWCSRHDAEKTADADPLVISARDLLERTKP